MRRFFMAIMALVCVVAVWAQPQNGKVYNIVAEDGRVLTIVGASREHDAYLYMAESINEGDEWAAQWAITDARGDGRTVTFVNPTSWMGIDQALTTTNKWMLTWDAEQTNANQQFVIREADGQYLIGNSAGQYINELEDGHIAMSTTGTKFTFKEVECDVVLYPGATVRIRSTVYDQVIGTGEKTDNDTPLVLENVDDERLGQVWTLRRVSADRDAFIMINALSGTAMDMALQSNVKRPLLWSADNNSSNQRVCIVEADGGYMIHNTASTTYYVTTQGKGATLASKSYYWSEPDEYTVFDFTAAVPPVIESKDWQDESVFGINKLPGHAAYMPYRTESVLRADAARLKQPWLDPVGADWMSLNGTWKFKYTAKDDDRPKTFFEPDFDVSAWDDIKVPGCIEMQGYDRPMYINVDYAFNDNPPYTNIKVSASQTGPSPVGSYRRTFTLPDGWSGRRTILHFDGIYSGAYVWVNGEKVGYTQGGNMDAEFDITPYVKVGTNDIAVEVFRWTDGSYIEGQDMFHMSGIHRDVYLYSVPQDYIRDHVIRATYESGYTQAHLAVDMEIVGTPQVYKMTVLDPMGNTVATCDGQVNMPDGDQLPTMVQFTADIDSPMMYSSESPDLYTVIISQVDEQGTDGMTFATKYGFCDVQMVGGVSGATASYITINGVRTYFKGVNTQDAHPVLGRTMDIATMWRDLTLMKQANINMVRTSHYPRSTKMNDMMAYLGLYICNEADVECHKNWEDKKNSSDRIANNSAWLPAMKDRWERLVMRDRNNPAVVMWSMGNESGNGNNFKAGYDLVRSLDPRPIHYEGASRDWYGWGYTDIRSVMYPTRSTMSSNLARPDQPFFYCEYNHAMGNAVGNLSDLWSVYNASSNNIGIYDSPNGIGGCIWDWVDQGIYEPRDILSGDTIASNGFPKYRSGYDFPGPHQGNFVNNGILACNRAWTPELTEVKAAYQYLVFTNYNKASGRLTMKSRLYHHTTDEMYTLHAIVLRNGVPVDEIQMDMPSIKPNETGSVSQKIATDMSDGAEYTLQVEARLKNATDWAEAGYPMATAEFMLQERGALAEVTLDPEQPFVTASTAGLRVSNANVNMTGEGTQVKKLLVGSLSVIDATDNAPTYNDFFWNENDTYNGRDNGDYSSTKTFTINDDKTAACYTIENQSTKCHSTFQYDVFSTGVVDLTVTFEPVKSDLRRIGFGMRFPDNYDVVEYYARGPWENYCDRMDGSYLLRVRTTVDDMYEAYAHPQSNGDHQDLRELRLVDRTTNDTLVITTEGQVGFSLSRYAESQYLTGTLHPSDLVRKDYIQAHFDYMVRGVGNKSCGAETAFEKYRCPSSGTYTFKLRFEARKYNDNDAISSTKDDATVTYINGIVTAPGRRIDVYDLGGARVASAHNQVSLLGQPRGIYLVKVAGALYKFVR